MLSVILETFSLLSKKDKVKFYQLTLLLIVVGAFEVVGVASILPFVAILSNRKVIHSNEYLEWLYSIAGFSSEKSFLIFFGCLVLSFLLFSIVLKAISQWGANVFSQNCRFELSQRFFRGYLSRPYSYFVETHSAHLSKALLSEVNQLATNAIMPVTQLVSSLVVALLLTALLFAVNPTITMLAFIFLAIPYAFIIFKTNAYLDNLGQRRRNANRERFHIIAESLNGIKDIKAMRLEEACVNAFQRPAREFSTVGIQKAVATMLPGHIFQGFTLVALMSLLIFLLIHSETRLEQAIPTIVLFVIATNRLQGSTQQIFQAISSMRFARAALNEIMNDQMEIEKLKEKNKSLKKVQIKSVKTDIAFANVNFSYPGHQKVILDNLNMRIKIGSSVAIVGATGAGKSTIIDILLGLITPSSGEINIDGEKLTEGNIDSWLDKIGYVSQSIFLKDDSVAANIAFGQLPDEMDLNTVEKAARLACIDDFIRNDLPSGYHTNVGERGVKLSGGQCQRISIARALYRDPKVLIFDEATSALDKRTEKKIVENIRAQQSGCTIIMVAHRFSTIEHCDTIFLMDEGKLIAHGSYKNLLEKNETFKHLAGSATSL